MAQKHIYLICGEASGDLHAGNLIRSLKVLNPGLTVSAIGGKQVAEAGAKIICDIKELSVMGLIDVLGKLPRFLSLKKLLLNKIKAEKPDAIIFVDFSGFNLRLAKAINKKIPTIYYISPQVWASREGRVETIRKYISKLIVLFQFEKEFYRKQGIDAEFVGHPLLDIGKPTMEINEAFAKFHLNGQKRKIALLPGSRKQEIETMLPLMLKTACLIHKELPHIQFLIAKAPQVEWHTFHKFTHATPLDLKVIEGKTYDCLNVSDFCLVTSGTATLEAAIMEKPFFVVYKMGLLNYLLYRPQVKIPYIGMVNIVAGKKIIPEFIQFDATAKKIAAEALKLLRSPEGMQEMRNNLKQIKPLLGENNANERAARIITDLLNRPLP